MELSPVVEIVKINRVARSPIGNARRAEDGTPGLIIVIVARDRAVQFLNRCLVEGGAGLIANPLLELRVGGSLLRNERNDRLPLQIEAIEDHLVKPVAYGRITVREFSARIERDLEPEPRQVQNAERSGDSGTEEGDKF